jgi:hypothetical protein
MRVGALLLFTLAAALYACGSYGSESPAPAGASDSAVTVDASLPETPPVTARACRDGKYRTIEPVNAFPAQLDGYQAEWISPGFTATNSEAFAWVRLPSQDAGLLNRIVHFNRTPSGLVKDDATSALGTGTFAQPSPDGHYLLIDDYVAPSFLLLLSERASNGRFVERTQIATDVVPASWVGERVYASITEQGSSVGMAIERFDPVARRLTFVRNLAEVNEALVDPTLDVGITYASQPYLTADERTMFFTSQVRAGGAQIGQRRLWIASRANSEPATFFDRPVALSVSNGADFTSYGNSISVVWTSGDGCELWFIATRASVYSLYRALHD